MTDQLSLELETGLPHPPARLRPMLPRPLPAPFDSPDHLFEPSWGGERVLAFIEPAVRQGPDGRYETSDGTPSLRLVDAGGRDVALRLPELAGLPLRVEASSAVLDGELVVVGPAGRPDPAALAERLDGRPGGDVAFLVFDVLYLDGRPLLGSPLVRRREALRRVLRPGAEVVAVPAIPTEGIALYEAVLAQGLAGILARQRSGPYLPGVRSRLWRWVAALPARPGHDVVPPSIAGAPEPPSAAVPGATGRRRRVGDAAPERAPWGQDTGGTAGTGGATEDGAGDAMPDIGGSVRAAGSIPGAQGPAEGGEDAAARTTDAGDDADGDDRAADPGRSSAGDPDDRTAPVNGSAAGVIAVFRRLPLETAEDDLRR